MDVYFVRTIKTTWKPQGNFVKVPLRHLIETMRLLCAIQSSTLKVHDNTVDIKYHKLYVAEWFKYKVE